MLARVPVSHVASVTWFTEAGAARATRGQREGRGLEVWPQCREMVFAFLNPANSRAGIVKTRGFFVLNIDFFVASLLSLLINTSWKNTENYKHKRLDRNFT